MVTRLKQKANFRLDNTPFGASVFYRFSLLTYPAHYKPSKRSRPGRLSADSKECRF